MLSSSATNCNTLLYTTIAILAEKIIKQQSGHSINDVRTEGESSLKQIEIAALCGLVVHQSMAQRSRENSFFSSIHCASQHYSKNCRLVRIARSNFQPAFLIRELQQLIIWKMFVSVNSNKFWATICGFLENERSAFLYGAPNTCITSVGSPLFGTNRMQHETNAVISVNFEL